MDHSYYLRYMCFLFLLDNTYLFSARRTKSLVLSDLYTNEEEDVEDQE